MQSTAVPPPGDLRSPLQAIGEEAQRALRERPKLSIRRRLSVGFLVWFVLSLGLAVISILTISQIKNKLHLTEAVDSYSFEIQQARRFEKNYFLYRTNLDDALEHVHNAQRILDTERDNMASVIGESAVRSMAGHVSRYEELLTQLQRLEGSEAADQQTEYADIETELREHGSEMVAVAQDLVARERRSVNAMLLISQRIPVAFLIVLILLIVYLTNFIARQMLAPLNRMVQAARRIAAGDVTPIVPRRKYHDEFSELALAMNHMMLQLDYRQNLLVEAHKLKAVGTLTAGVAHELNNPINNIMLTASMLLEDYADLSESERVDMVEDCVSESERAQRIVRNLLDFARESNIESGAIRAEELVEDTLQLATNQIKLAKVKVKGEVDHSLPPVYGDRQQLTQVFLNVVLNALDAMPGGGSLSISIGNTKDRDFVAFEFTDTGVGIPEDRLETIFDPFFTTKSDSKGTGLGLPLSLGIIKQHGGDIRVRSRVGEGTTFTVLLPVAKVPAHILDERQADDAVV
ncbi:MAG: HAMP domain-containing protein [Gemmatimonadales bacterium]|nr:HAMP domain-containing protein [Gemmatimonadales bacterium]